MGHQKRLSAPKHYPVERKENTYISTIKGSRSSEEAIPAVVLLRDVLEFAENEKEAKEIIKNGDLMRNGERVKDIKEGIGLLDVVELEEAEKSYRAVRDGENLAFITVEDPEKVAAKIVDKKNEADRFIYNLHNGENYSTKDEYDTGNTLIFNGNVEEVSLEEGSRILVVDGSHAGTTAELEEINHGGMDEDTVKIVTDKGELQTRKENIVAVSDLEVE